MRWAPGYIGRVLLDWRKGILLFFGILLLAVIIGGVVLNTIFLVREIRRHEQHDAFTNAVTPRTENSGSFHSAVSGDAHDPHGQGGKASGVLSDYRFVALPPA